jgi:competence protein ComEA
VIDGADASLLPLAMKLSDGQRLYVPRPGETPPAPVVVAAASASSPGSSTPAGPININQATVQQLDGLPGVGPATAAAIVAYRDKHGPFRNVQALVDVPGIGEAKVAAWKELVTV